jgi:hypothetical protein
VAQSVAGALRMAFVAIQEARGGIAVSSLVVPGEVIISDHACNLRAVWGAALANYKLRGQCAKTAQLIQIGCVKSIAHLAENRPRFRVGIL